MNNIVLPLVCILGFTIAGFAQKSSHRPQKGMCPLKDGVIWIDTSSRIIYGGPNRGIEIESKDSLVYSATTGSVEAIFSVGDVKAMMIRTGNFFYTYSNLDSVFVKKGDSIQAGKPI